MGTCQVVHIKVCIVCTERLVCIYVPLLDRALASLKITSALASTVKQFFCWSWSYLAIYLVKYLLGDKVGNIIDN